MISLKTSKITLLGFVKQHKKVNFLITSCEFYNSSKLSPQQSQEMWFPPFSAARQKANQAPELTAPEVQK